MFILQILHQRDHQLAQRDAHEDNTRARLKAAEQEAAKFSALSPQVVLGTPDYVVIVVVAGNGPSLAGDSTSPVLGGQRKGKVPIRLWMVETLPLCCLARTA